MYFLLSNFFPRAGGRQITDLAEYRRLEPGRSNRGDRTRAIELADDRPRDAGVAAYGRICICFLSADHFYQRAVRIASATRIASTAALTSCVRRICAPLRTKAVWAARFP